MEFRLRPLAKKVLPQAVVDALRSQALNLPHAAERIRAQRAFSAATNAPPYLGVDVLETLQNKYSPPPEYGWDERAVEVRGMQRAARILRLPGARLADSFLELGCWDGMVCSGLCLEGKSATAIDSRDDGFDARASRAGARLLRMDAAQLDFADECFDFVYSYDAFEHFASPEAVLREAIRVVKAGGFIYLDFGPLYYSAMGEHAYNSITVPYCQHLFPRQMLNDFATHRGLKPIRPGRVNGWALESYRQLWDKYDYILKKVRYRERLDLSHVDLIRMFPSCFKSKSQHFDGFVVASISALFRKSSNELGEGETPSSGQLPG